MTEDTLIARLFYLFGLIFLHAVIGFGPGFIIGIILGNLTGGRGREPLASQHRKNIRSASEHNAQWNPSHERWQKPPGH
jgi:hypothetical protein